MHSKLQLLFALLGVLIACARPPDLIGVNDPETAPSTVPKASEHRIFIATSRAPSNDEREFYSSQRSDVLGLAAVTVSVPADREPGTVERPRTLPPDATREFAVVDPERFVDGHDFVRSLNKALAARRPDNRDILLFVHGFNNTLSDSVLRVAQFVEDSGFEGVAILFSWASAARVSRYAYDLNSVLAARPSLEEASSFIVQSDATGFDVFAHSMGTMLVSEVMVQSDLRGNLNRTRKLRTVTFASPDIDIDVFKSQLSQIRQLPVSPYVLVSSDDRALQFSRRIAGGVDRVGAADLSELEGLGLTVIDLSEIDDSNSGSHSKFAGSPEAVQLIGRTLSEHGYSNNTQAGFGDFLTIVPDTVKVFRP
ncbi:alpha/beta hydrolase [Roseobacter ponti]|uniref:Alpha/beta hydrolase n=1 Tax=Roseobacter ponti TaxID=1891787 RepID=A0A858SRW1_9RHOB|nr:alpha/beta hydrolase [Roseobacter ponti]QJF50727.1 alpha/beta hydrolase [Roseobacter ponti]